jgi:hypothetical protein
MGNVRDISERAEAWSRIERFASQVPPSVATGMSGSVR